MNRLVMIGSPVLLIVALVVVAMAPIGPLPGFFIGGEPTPVPEEWGNTLDVDVIELEVATGALPRVVVIWMVQFDGDLHVVGSNDSGWVSGIGAGSPVRLKMHGKTYSLIASRLSGDAWTAALEAYRDKYIADNPGIFENFPSVDEARETVAVFRLAGS